MKALNCILSVLVFACLLAQIIVRHETRLLYTELRGMEEARDELVEEWGRVQLELGTWASHDRIEYIARHDLGLRAAGEEKLMVIEQ